jgi:hypothetical protein
MLSFLKRLVKPLFAEEYSTIANLQKDLIICQERNNDYTRPIDFPEIRTMLEWFAGNPAMLHAYETKTYDCDDYARKTQEYAMRDGWLVNVQADPTGLFGDGVHPHMLCSAVVGDTCHIMEPQTGKLVGYVRLD